ncbi:MAG: hypothetical protein RR053_07995, partial [Evtepia sp.]
NTVVMGDYLWVKGREVVVVRIPSKELVQRPITRICMEEIAEAMYAVASATAGMTRKDLYLATARVFGFSRTGGRITDSMEAAYDYLRSCGRIKAVKGKK